MSDSPHQTDGRPRTKSGTGEGSDGQHLAGHGNSVAAWTGVGIVLLGAAVCSVAVVITSLWVFVGGVVVVVLGAVTGKVMSAMGYGSTVHQDSPTSTRQGTR